MLSACAVIQPAPVDDLIKDSLPEATEIPLNYQEAANAATGAVVDGWLSTFGDPELEAIVAEAIQNNLNLRAAVARVDAAAGFATQAGAELMPVVGIGGSGLAREGFSSSAPSVAANGIALNASWELDLWGRVRSQAQAGQAAFEATQYQLEWAYQSIAAQTTKVWFLVTEASLQLQLAREALGLYQRTQDIVEAKYQQGRVTSREIALARANVASGQVVIRQADGARQQAARALEVILGRYPAAKIKGAEDFIAIPPPIPLGIPSELLQRRPDLRAAERTVAARFLSIQTAEAARLPTISLTAGAGASSAELADLLALDSSFWSVGANFMAPIFTGGALKAQVDINSAQFQEAMANYGLVALTAFSEVEQGLANETLLQERETYL
ncbi:MAG: efflux transporter outer membrane subunit, partial [Gammaproteobacteria bacterium]|nr:efflux transporter outer membrane subunit [Gammaproteobacteria bacterium]